MSYRFAITGRRPGWSCQNITCRGRPFRAIDSHAHLGRWLSPDQSWMVQDVPRLLAEMDQCNIAGIVNLDGRWGKELADNLARYDHAYPGRFATCCHLDWRELSMPGFGERLAARAARLRRCRRGRSQGVERLGPARARLPR